MDNNKIFGQFNGADLDRLIKCVAKVRKEGLKLDKYCQAGVNNNSGNVYIWSEDWAGCVYCSIGFDVSWSYSCGECGEDRDFETEQDCREYAEKHDYKCESCNPESEGGIDGETVCTYVRANSRVAAINKVKAGEV